MYSVESIKLKTIEKLLLNRKRQEINRAVAKKVENVIDFLNNIKKPQIYFQLNKIKVNKNIVSIVDSDISFKSNKLSKSLKYCNELISCLVSLGPDVDTQIDNFTKRNRMSEAYILDLMSSITVENMIETFQKKFQNRLLKEGKDVSLRFSPGYCDWSLKEQKKLFRLFGNNQNIVTLSDTLLMTPRKSISGVFGLYSKSRFTKEKYNPCLECNKKSCIARRL